ncbi:phage portal protein [Sphingobium baderi]|uniref:Uncharacterized protein n=1 Tax=Sphingobium baderi LL03 TaxID=1114964 RepID=T0G8A3_9SPHN|nr:phage portal protein [Sphingobium baderi]EQA96841.1 hypothetical protein L485_22430 [Sphingobium baderi LL03]
MAERGRRSAASLSVVAGSIDGRPSPPSDLTKVQKEVWERTVEGVRYQRRDIDVLHIRGFGGGPLGGASPLTVCRRTFGLAQDIDTSSAGFFANGVRASGVMKLKDSLNAEQREAAARHVRSARSSAPIARPLSCCRSAA